MHQHNYKLSNGLLICSCGSEAQNPEAYQGLNMLNKQNQNQTNSQHSPSSQPLCLYCKSAPSNNGFLFCSRNCGQKHNAYNSCDTCKKKPKNPGFNFCSKKCGSIYNKLNASNPNSNMCDHCKKSPKNSGFNFCSKACGISFNTAKLSNSSLEMCFNCKNKPKNRRFQFCSSKCGSIYNAVNLCDYCNKSPKNVGFEYCSRMCGSLAKRNGSPITQFLPSPTAVTLLSPADRDYVEISEQFLNAWKHPNKHAPNQILAVLRIRPSQLISTNFYAYQNSVTQRMQGVQLEEDAGAANTLRRFHGTTLACHLHSTSSPCFSPHCRMCGIIREGFDLSLVGTGSKGNFSRFGSGAYFSSISSKSDDYSDLCEQYLGKGVRAMLVASVVAGRCEKRDKNDNSPPREGFDSVYGQVSPNGNLNYDEIVIYNHHAILPSFIIVYKF